MIGYFGDIDSLLENRISYEEFDLYKNEIEFQQSRSLLEGMLLISEQVCLTEGIVQDIIGKIKAMITSFINWIKGLFQSKDSIDTKKPEVKKELEVTAKAIVEGKIETRKKPEPEQRKNVMSTPTPKKPEEKKDEPKHEEPKKEEPKKEEPKEEPKKEEPKQEKPEPYMDDFLQTKIKVYDGILNSSMNFDGKLILKVAKYNNVESVREAFKHGKDEKVTSSSVMQKFAGELKEIKPHDIIKSHFDNILFIHSHAADLILDLNRLNSEMNSNANLSDEVIKEMAQGIAGYIEFLREGLKLAKHIVRYVNHYRRKLGGGTYDKEFSKLDKANESFIELSGMSML